MLNPWTGTLWLKRQVKAPFAMPVGWTGWREQNSWELSRGIGDYFVTGTDWHSTICLSVGGGEGWLSSISSPPKCHLFFHWEEDGFSASSASVTGSCVLYGDIPLGSRAACTRVTPLALPGWFTIPGIVVALFGPSNSCRVWLWAGNRDGKVQISSGQGVEPAVHTTLQKYAVILSSQFSCVQWFVQSLEAGACLTLPWLSEPALMDLTRSWWAPWCKFVP